MVMLLLKKSIKSIQNRLNEFFKELECEYTNACASAFTKARSKLLHTAFIELNQKAIVDIMYNDESYKKYKEFRLCAIDGSKLRLPDEPSIREHFGTRRYANQVAETNGKHSYAMVSVCYDLLNKIAISSVIDSGEVYELDLIQKHIGHRQTNDLWLMDRLYGNYLAMSRLKANNINFVIRCSKTSFSCVKAMFKNSSCDSSIVTIDVTAKQRQRVEQLGLPNQIKVRLVRVILDNGTVEVLVTSLLDEELYPSSEFKDLYWKRWGIETFFDRIKNRLELQHFTGKTVESVMQDFFATIFISGLESILTDDANEILEQKSSNNRYPQIVNKSVSFNTIKNHVVELIDQDFDTEILFQRLTELFLSNPVTVRNSRQVPRKNISTRARAYYYKDIKKRNF